MGFTRRCTVLTATILLMFVRGGAAKTQPPNIIVFVADDMGYANIGFNNPGPHVKTPNLDKAAHEGIILGRHYTYCWCAPSRSSLMTGRLSYHVFETTNHVERRMTMMPAKLAQAGYRTHQIGKWHLGLLSPWMTPAGRGFNSSFGYLAGGMDHYTQSGNSGEYGCEHLASSCVDFYHTDRPAYGKNGSYGDLVYSAEMVRIIDEHDTSVPLFMYVALQVLHAPEEVPSSYSDQFPAPQYISDYAINAGMGIVADEAFGNMTQALLSRRMWDNTIVVFTSDNGGSAARLTEVQAATAYTSNNYPFRGGKTNHFEGGIRVAAFLTGGFLPDSMRGKKLDGYISIADWYATLLPLAGVDASDNVPDIPGVDGMNMWPYLTGKQEESPRTEIMIATQTLANRSDPFAGALISGRYKIVLGMQTYGMWFGPVYPNATTKHSWDADDNNVDCRAGCLFNIIDDPGEHNDLAKQLPDIHQQMIARWKELSPTRYQAPRHKTDDAQCEAYVKAHKGFCGPYLDDTPTNQPYLEEWTSGLVV